MFEFIVKIFDVLLYQPLFNALVVFYNYLPGHDFGVAIIILTILIRLILYPVSVKALKSQKTLQSIQSKLQEIQKKYKDDKEKQVKETLELYRKEKINPFSGLFLAIIQFPILIALYWVFWRGLNPSELKNLYSFVSNPGQLSANFLGIINLSKPNIIFAFLAGIVQFYQTKTLTPKTPKKQTGGTDVSQIMQKQMLYFFPILTVVILLGLPSALGLYWIASGAFSIIQQYFILKKSNEAEKK
jgi:YidC/Oxa1 family membrane protein insertase